MGLNPARKIRTICRNGCNLRFPVAPLFAFALTGCNTCVTITSNPPVTVDGAIHPLQFDDASLELRIPSNKMEGAYLPLLPDTHTDLIIEWKLMWEWSSSADKGVRLLPTLASSAKVRQINLDELGTPEGGVVNDSRSR